MEKILLLVVKDYTRLVKEYEFLLRNFNDRGYLVLEFKSTLVWGSHTIL